MYSIARLPEDERRILFRNTAQKMGMNEGLPDLGLSFPSM